MIFTKISPLLRESSSCAYLICLLEPSESLTWVIELAIVSRTLSFQAKVWIAQNDETKRRQDKRLVQFFFRVTNFAFYFVAKNKEPKWEWNWHFLTNQYLAEFRKSKVGNTINFCLQDKMRLTWKTYYWKRQKKAKKKKKSNAKKKKLVLTYFDWVPIWIQNRKIQEGKWTLLVLTFFNKTRQ